MKINKLIVLALLLVALLTLAVASQINTPSSISVEEAKTCNTVFYDEVQPIYGTCINYYNYTSCLNTSGLNTDCSLIQTTKNYTCKTSELIIKRNATECKPLNKFTVSVVKGAITERKEIDFSTWGVCIQSVENDCVAITCGTSKGGSAVNSIFNGCDGGKSCQKFLFCQDGTKVLYKNSREDFVEYDPTFHLSKLAYKGVGE